MAFAALVLAGSRPGPDPLAAYAGAPHKALITLSGRTLAERVVTALRQAGASRICASANDPLVVEAFRSLGVEVLPAAEGPSQSVALALETMGAPLLVTTCDHALLEPEWITDFLADAPAGGDVAVLLGSRDRVEAAAPGARRTYLKFADGQWSGCNLFLIATPRADLAVRFWRRLEAERKRPWRMAGLIGPGALIAYLLGSLTLTGAVERLGRKIGVTAHAVASRHGLAAVDVDKPADLDLVRRLVGEAAP